MTKKKSRGGLGNNIPKMFGLKNVAEARGIEPVKPAASELFLSQLQPGKYQARKEMSEDTIADLAKSIKEKGVINPIAVRDIGHGRYEILAGERRYRAAMQAGLKKVPVNILKADNEDALAIGLIENLQREDLSAIDAANGINRLIKDFSFTHEQAAKIIGRSRAYVTNLIRLLDLPQKIQNYLQEGALDAGHARALLSIQNEQQQLDLAEKIVNQGLSVRQVEALVAKKKPTEKKEPVQPNPTYEKMAEKLSRALGANVRVSSRSAGKGKIEITFASEKELQEIFSNLLKKKI